MGVETKRNIWIKNKVHANCSTCKDFLLSRLISSFDSGAVNQHEQSTQQVLFERIVIQTVSSQ